MSFTITYAYRATDKFTPQLAKMAREAERLTARITSAVGRTATAFIGVDKAAARARASIGNMGRLSGQLQGMALNAERYAAAMRKAAAARLPALSKAPVGGAGAGRRGGRIDALDGLLAAGGALGITAGMSAGARSAVALETSLLDVQRLSDLDSAGMARFDAMTAGLSKRFAKSRAELNQMASSAISAGVALGDMEKFLSFSAMAAVAAEFGSAEEAGQVLGTIQAQLRIGIDEMIRLGDQVNVVADRTNTTSQKMFDVLERGAGTMAGWATESQTAMAGFFSNLEPRSEKAATALSAMITKLKVMSGPIGKAMQEDGVKGLQLYFEKLNKIADPLKRQKVLLKHFGQEHVDVAEKAMVRISELDDLLTMVSSNGAVGSLKREYALSMSGMKGATLRFKAAWENMKATVFDKGLGKGLLDGLSKAVDRINAFTDSNPQMAKFITLAAGATAATVGLAGMLAVIALVALPIWLVVGAIGATAGAMAWAWSESALFRDQVSKLIEEAEALFEVLGITDEGFRGLAKTIGEALGEAFAELIVDVRVFVSRLTHLVKMVKAIKGGRIWALPSLWAGMQSATDGIRREATYDRIMSKMDAPEVLAAIADGGGGYASPSAVERAEAARTELVNGMPAYLLSGGTGAPGAPGLASGTQGQGPLKLDIMVRSESGTSATVNKANLPTGSNVRTGR